MKTVIYSWPYRRAECVHYPDGRVVCVRLIGRGGKDLLTAARSAAADIHGGQTDPAYAFASTGTIRGEHKGTWDLRDSFALDDKNNIVGPTLRALAPALRLCELLKGE